MDNYRQIRRISNSDLTIAKVLMSGKDWKKPEKAFSIGTAFHEFVIEKVPLQISEFVQEKEIDMIQRMAQNLKKHRIWNTLRLTRHVNREKVWLFETENTDCKGKTDMIISQTLFDLKTTSCRSEKDFEDSIVQWEYDRQVAFYLEATGLKKACIVGVSKVSDQIFILNFDRDSKTVSNGENKFRHLLRMVRNENLYDRIFAMSA